MPLEMSSARRWAITVGVMTGSFIAALEATVVGTAMPTVIASLGGINHYSWVFSAYIVTSTVTVPVWGKLSDLYGRRLLYQLGIFVFLLGTLLSGLSTSMTELIIFRAIQGLGAGALIPLGMTSTDYGSTPGHLSQNGHKKHLNKCCIVCQVYFL